MRVTLIGEKDEYRVVYDAKSGTISLDGVIILREKEKYRPIAEFLESVADENPDTITLDIRNLKFLNSSGIAAIAGFVANTRIKEIGKLMVRYSKECTWQGQYTEAMSKIVPGISLMFE